MGWHRLGTLVEWPNLICNYVKWRSFRFNRTWQTLTLTPALDRVKLNCLTDCLTGWLSVWVSPRQRHLPVDWGALTGLMLLLSDEAMNASMAMWAYEERRRRIQSCDNTEITNLLSTFLCKISFLHAFVLFAIRTISNEWEFHFFANYIIPDKIFVVPQIFIRRRDRKALNEIAWKGITLNVHFARVVNIVLIRGLVNNLLQHHYQRWKLIGKAEHYSAFNLSSRRIS